jgi:Family of unknown function (DUF5519)
MLARMDDGHAVSLWDALVAEMLATGKAHERRSRYGDKPAVYIDGREVAHLEAPQIIDLRITRQGWSRVKGEYGSDPAVFRDPSRPDWIELRPHSPQDLERLAGLLAVAIAENA